MDLIIDSRELAALHAHAEQGYPHEVVGILAGDRSTRTVTRIHPLVNERADSPQNRYRVNGMTVLRAEQALEGEGLQVVGYYHSHPDHTAQYSAYDRDHALPNMSYLITAVSKGAVVDTLSWRLREDRSAMDPESLTLMEAP